MDTTKANSTIMVIDEITNGLEMVMSGLAKLRALYTPKEDFLDFDPLDPANKDEKGKLTKRGAEVCYRLFDAGKSRNAVAGAMGITFTAANYRYDLWQEEGGVDRVQRPLD